MRHLLPFLAGALILLVSCQPVVNLEKPKLTLTVKDEGATLEVSWDAVTDAEGYKVYFDGSATADTTLTATKIAITDAKKSIKVEAYNGSETNDSTVSTTAVTTSSVTVYGMNDPNQYFCAFGFGSDGSALALNCTLTTDYPKIDYVMEDRNSVPMSFWSPNEYTTPPINAKINGSLESGTDFDGCRYAPTTGTYTTKTQIVQNSVYALWMGTTTQWQATDHFAKAKVVGVSGETVTLKLAYQPIGGLRWFRTD